MIEGRYVPKTPSTEVFAFFFHEETDKATGLPIKVCFWDRRRPVKKGVKYKRFSTLKAFNDFCKLNNIHQRSASNG